MEQATYTLAALAAILLFAFIGPPILPKKYGASNNPLWVRIAPTQTILRTGNHPSGVLKQETCEWKLAALLALVPTAPLTLLTPLTTTGQPQDAVLTFVAWIIVNALLRQVTNDYDTVGHNIEILHVERTDPSFASKHPVLDKYLPYRAAEIERMYYLDPVRRKQCDEISRRTGLPHQTIIAKRLRRTEWIARLVYHLP